LLRGLLKNMGNVTPLAMDHVLAIVKDDVLDRDMAGRYRNQSTRSIVDTISETVRSNPQFFQEFRGWFGDMPEGMIRLIDSLYNVTFNGGAVDSRIFFESPQAGIALLTPKYMRGDAVTANVPGAQQ